MYRSVSNRPVQSTDPLGLSDQITSPRDMISDTKIADHLYSLYNLGQQQVKIATPRGRGPLDPNMYQIEGRLDVGNNGSLEKTRLRLMRDLAQADGTAFNWRGCDKCQVYRELAKAFSQSATTRFYRDRQSAIGNHGTVTDRKNHMAITAMDGYIAIVAWQRYVKECKGKEGLQFPNMPFLPDWYVRGMLEHHADVQRPAVVSEAIATSLFDFVRIGIQAKVEYEVWLEQNAGLPAPLQIPLPMRYNQQQSGAAMVPVPVGSYLYNSYGRQQQDGIVRYPSDHELGRIRQPNSAPVRIRERVGR